MVVVEVDTARHPGRDALLVWNELYRGENARGVPGSGIGLALVRAIAERHNGEVFLRSRLGRTVFTVRLPVYRKRAPALRRSNRQNLLPQQAAVGGTHQRRLFPARAITQPGSASRK